MKVEKKDVHIEVLRKPSSGLFRLNPKTAKVRVTLKTQPTPSSQAGLVRVVDGRVEYVGPERETAPTIRFGKEVVVLYHGEPIEAQLELSDGIGPLEIILPENRSPQLQYEIRVNESKTKAELFWKR